MSNESTNQAGPAPLHCVVGRLRAFVIHETYLDVKGIAFAASAGKARMIAARSAWDAGFPASITTLRVRREPSLDGRCPANYKKQFFSMEHVQYLPQPNHQGHGPAANETDHAQMSVGGSDAPAGSTADIK